MSLYLVQCEGDHRYVEATSFSDAIAKHAKWWAADERKYGTEITNDDDVPVESVSLVSDEDVIR